MELATVHKYTTGPMALLRLIGQNKVARAFQGLPVLHKSEEGLVRVELVKKGNGDRAYNDARYKVLAVRK